MATAQNTLQKLSIANIKIGSARKTHFHGKLTFKSEAPEKVVKGKPFRVAHVNFQDADSEIRMSFFDGQIEQHFKALELNRSYDVGKFAVVPSEKKYTSLDHEFEMRPLAGSLTKIVLLPEGSEVNPAPVEPSKIADIEHVGKDKLIDILGVVSHVGELEGPSPTSSRKRVIRVVDQSECEVETTLWGSSAEDFEGDVNSVFSAKRLKKSDFRGHSLTLSQYTILEVNPNSPETKSLQEWYGKAKSSIQFRALSTDVYRRQTLVDSLATEKPTDFFTAKVNIKSIDKRRDPFYMACTQCFKKVVEQDDGKFLCAGEKCEPKDTFCWRIILKTKLLDNTAEVDADVFTDASEKLLGLTVDGARTLF